MAGKVDVAAMVAVAGEADKSGKAWQSLAKPGKAWQSLAKPSKAS